VKNILKYVPISLLYWAALKSNYTCLKDWADDIRKMYGNNLEYPFDDAVELVEKYWTGKTNGSKLR